MLKLTKRLTIVMACLIFAFTAISQTTVRGILLDTQTRESLIGATVTSDKSENAAVSDTEGNFEIQLPSEKQTLKINYVGYDLKTIIINPTGKNLSLGEIEMDSKTFGLNEVMVTASVGIARKTPVAMSTLPASIIQETLGTQEFPEVLNVTPGIYATKVGGGFGDSRINVRGFETVNTAMMINGVPVNDMEWGGVYWSNWTGLSEVTRSMQVQRGLGASKIAAPSVGGSINIVTKTTDAQKGGSIFYGLGNDGYNKLSFSVSTGLMDNGWALNILGAKNWAKNYILGTEYEGYTYFASVSKRINENHEISLTGFGAPQWHNQRSSSDRLLIIEWQKYKEKYRYNPTYGTDSYGNRYTANYNYFHKPQISLNHVWTINDKSALTTVLYTSIGRGGGYSGRGTNSNAFYGASNGIVNTTYRTSENYFDYGKLIDENAANANGSLAVLTSSINSHNWYGLLSTYTTKIGDYFNVYGGIDLRTYAGIHTNKIVDLMGGKFYIDNTRNTSAAINRKEYGDPAWYNQRLTIGDIVYRDYTGNVNQGGFFGQGEYNRGKLSAFVSASVNNNWYWRTDRFYYNNVKSDVASHAGWMAKGGANYNINKNHNVFFNFGGFSRTPYLSGGIFLNSTSSNAINTGAKNEKILSTEVGYGFRSSIFSANINAYYTHWINKTAIRALNNNDPDLGTINLTGVGATHKGVELDFICRPVKDLELNGMFSYGDWRWTGEGYALLYNKDDLPIDITGNVVSDETKQAWLRLNMNNVHVGNAAQMTGSLDLSYVFLPGWKAGLTYRYIGNNYAYYSIAIPNFNTTSTLVEPWKMPDGNVFNFRMNYRFKFNKLDAVLQGNIENLFDAVYISDASDGSTHDWTTATVFYGFGRTWSASLRINF